MDIQACNQNVDDDKDESRCAEAFVIPLKTGPTMGTHPMLADGIHYQYEVQVSDLLNTDKVDLRALKGDEVIWELSLPDDMQWTSVITVTDDHLIGTATAFTDSGDALLTVELPATAKVTFIIRRTDGEVVFRAPTTDDSTATVTVGRDGALYVHNAFPDAYPRHRYSACWRTHAIFSRTPKE